jgi:ABC-2 type transport system ATP-binding protein
VVIVAEGLSKRFGSRVAVDGLSFTLTPGQVTGFLGPNGAGKSTTMRMIIGLDRPNAGHVTVDGQAYQDLPDPLRVVGCLLDAKSLHPKRTARNHLRWMAAANGIPDSRVDEVLGLVGLTDVAGQRAGQFSLGMSQRLGIAGALLGDPPVLLFDEPVNGLDPDGILWVRTFMKAMAAEGRTVFVSSHLLSEMSLTADHLLIIGRGKLMADVPMADFLSRSATAVHVRSPRLGELVGMLQHHGGQAEPTDDGAAAVTGMTASQIGDLAAQYGFVLHELSPQGASLEAAYMELTREAVEYGAPSGAQRTPAPPPPPSVLPPPPPSTPPTDGGAR